MSSMTHGVRCKRRTGLLARVLVPVVVLCSTVISGCSPLDTQYLSDENSGALVGIPAGWNTYDGEQVLGEAARRIGQGLGKSDTAVATKWMIGFDGSKDPAISNLLSPNAETPTGMVRARWLKQQEDLSINALFGQGEDMGLVRSDGGIVSRVANGKVTVSGAQGIDVTVTRSYPEGTVLMYRQVTVVDLLRNQMVSLFVGCSKACWQANSVRIEEILETFTVRVAKLPQR